MLTFKIIPKCYQDASRYDGQDADFYIELDAWDDQGYHVMYHLHATRRLTGTENVYLGYIDVWQMLCLRNWMSLLRKWPKILLA